MLRNRLGVGWGRDSYVRLEREWFSSCKMSKIFYHAHFEQMGLESLGLKRQGFIHPRRMKSWREIRALILWSWTRAKQAWPCMNQARNVTKYRWPVLNIAEKTKKLLLVTYHMMLNVLYLDPMTANKDPASIFPLTVKSNDYIIYYSQEPIWVTPSDIQKFYSAPILFSLRSNRPFGGHKNVRRTQKEWRGWRDGCFCISPLSGS